MKNVLKSIVFVLIFGILYISLSYLFLPKRNLKTYGIYNTSLYEILAEKRNTVDVLFIGDSLVYSSVSPMDIYGKYGYTVFDCSEPAQILPDAYKYLQIAVETQHPKVVIIEPNIFFRDAKKRPWYNKPLKVIKNSLPLVTYHNNWKKMIFSNKGNGLNNFTKGYKKNVDINPSRNYNYMDRSNKERKFPKANYEYVDKFIKYAEDNNIKLLFIALPSQKSWSNGKHKTITRLSELYSIPYVNLNFNDIVEINWVTETKDFGDHLNDTGAKKVSDFIGKYLSDLNVLENHKGKKGYEAWDNAYKYYLSN